MSSKKPLPPIFDGFSQKQVYNLYNIADVRHYETGQVIFKEKEIAEHLYVILHGKIVKALHHAGKKREIESLERGAWLGVSEFSGKAPYGATAVAREPSKVMVFDERKVELFDDKMKQIFYREMAKWSARESCELAAQNKQLLVLNQRCKKKLYEARVPRPDDYRNSPLVRDMIEQVPRLPLFVHTLTSRLMDENATAGQIAEIIQQDPSLTADVLRKVNSPYYGIGSKISDISSAVLFLGFEALYQVAISEGLRRSMPETNEFEHIHTRALVTSQMLFSMSRSTGNSIPVRMATIGLLHNLGRSVGELFIKKNPDQEIMVNLIDQSQLGALLLAEWELPEAISRTVLYQDYPEFAPPAAIPEDVIDNVTLLYFAKLCYQLLCGTPESKLLSVYTEEYKSRLGWDGLSINEILKKYVMVDLMKKINTLPEFIRQLFYNFRDN